jgi:AraC-like DNA-binding protein
LSGTLSTLSVRPVLLALARAGVDARGTAAFLADLGLDAGVFEQAEARIPAEVAFRAFERAIELTGDEQLFLRTAEALPMGALQVLDFAVRSSATMGEALARVARYYALLDDNSTLRVEVKGKVARLVGRRTEPPSPRPATELLFALILARGREFTGRPCPLHEVSFLQGPPRDRSRHEAFFGVPVHFGRARNELVFDASWLEVPCRAFDPELASFLDQQVSKLLERVAPPKSFTDEVRRAIESAIRGSDPLLEATAKRLGMGTRTLQRRLRDLGTSHKDLLEEVRRELAEKLLGESRMPIGEVAYLLGFSDASAFHHAFGRWTRTTPSAYRAEKNRRRV